VDHTDKVRQLVEQLENADPSAQARHYAEIFAQLMEYEKFQAFVRDNYLIEYYLEEGTGTLAVAVRELLTSEDEGPEADFANAFNETIQRK